MMAAEDIAVVGLACLFPGAPDLATFWRNILAKVDAISDPPPEAWDPAVCFDARSEENDRVYCKKGGYLGPLAEFDPLEHGIMPRAVEGGEPDQWLALRVARQALRDAGCEDLTAYRERAALILGKGTYANRGTLSMVQHAMLVDYTLDLLKSVQPALDEHDLRHIRADLKRRLPRFDAETAPALIPNVTVGRLANRLDVMGPSYTVDAACASSLVAIDIAVKGLRLGEYDVALVGGLQVATPEPVLSLFCQLKALSPSGRIRPFDKDADGTLLSEGVGMAVLKRRSHAERDGDRIYALVKGTGVASDGRAVGVLAPRVEGEELALRRAYELAAVAPGTVGLIEAHGTGTLVGDAVEVAALSRVLGDRHPRCALGSVKSMIGHTMPAAGMAGFIKTVLALYHKVLPPTLNVSEPSPRLELERTRFYLNTDTRPWLQGRSLAPRRAGVNAFGFGGINAHVVVEEHEAAGPSATLDTQWDSELCLVAGRNREELSAHVRQVTAALKRRPDVPLADVARALSLDVPSGGLVLGIVAQTVGDLERKLDKAAARLADASCRRIKDASGIYFTEAPLAATGTLAFLFPGEGSQYVNMLADLCRHFPVVRAPFDQVDRMFARHPRGYVLSDFLYPPPLVHAGNGRHDGLFQVDVAVEAVLTANHALHALLIELGIRPHAVVGHSTGEFSAMRAAGVLDGEDERRTLEINDLYLDAVDADRVPPSVDLIAIGAARERVVALCDAIGEVAVAMDNCRHQVVVAAQGSVSAALQARCRAEGLLYEVLPFDRPYHTPIFAGFAESMRGFLTRWIARPPAVPLYSCTTTRPYPATLDEMRAIAHDHWIKPVEFRRTIEQMYADGVRLFVEAGPRGNLTAFVDDVLGGRDYSAIPANVMRRSGLEQLHHLLAQLAAHGVRPGFAPLYERRHPGVFDWRDAAPATPARRLRAVKIPTGASAMSLSPETVEAIRRRQAPPASQPPIELASRPDAAAPPPAPARVSLQTTQRTDEVVSAFFGTMGTLLSLEQDLMGVASRDAASHDSRPAAWPFLDAIVSMQPGESLTARCTVGLEMHPFLRDHTVGRNVSASDPTLSGFPIVPFTALMEMMAEAASALAPGRVVVGLSDVRVSRWLAADETPPVLEIRADQDATGRTRVRITEIAAAALGPVAEGLVLLADRYPDPPRAGAFDLPDRTPYKWPPARLYDVAMFHGPLFRGVRSVDAFGSTGATATLEVRDRRGLLAGDRDRFVTDFVLLDQPGPVVGFWAAQQFERGFFVLPLRLASLSLYGPPSPPGERLTCHARIAGLGEHELRSTLEIVDGRGFVRARLEGWDDRRFDLPAAAHAMLRETPTAQLARMWPMPGRDAVLAARVGLDDFPPGWLHAFGGLWARVLASLVLGRRERAIWQTSKMPPARRLEWLLGRIAAKDAVREHLRRRRGMTVPPADVEILPDAVGRPVASGAWTADVAAPLVSISHVDGAAIAIAGDAAALSGVGIDLERRGRMTRPMEDIAFSDEERAILGAFADEERDAWSVRLWCAKEAFAKSTGCAVGPSSRALAVERVHRDDGTVLLRYRGAGEDVSIAASTTQDGDWVVATCLGATRVAETIEGARS